jgi:hypothetical protein
MSMTGMYMLNVKYNEKKTNKALEILYSDRKNHFRELSESLLSEKAIRAIPYWREFVLNFCLDVEDSFLSWTEKSSLSPVSPQKSLVILRQLGKNKKSMNQIAKLLNMSYDMALEFKEIYKRLA